MFKSAFEAVEDPHMNEVVNCPTCGTEADHLIGRLYRCNVCKSNVKNWVQPTDQSTRSETPREETQSTG